MNVVRYFDGARFHVGLLVKTGAVHDHVIVFKARKVRALRFAADDDSQLEYLPDDPTRARAHFQTLAQSRGITDTAKQLLESTA